MKKYLLLLTLCCTTLLVSVPAQVNVRPFPKAALTAKTVAIINNTHTEAVSDGAMDALKRWGRFTIVDDSDAADIVLTFEKKNEHEGTSTQKTNDDGKTDPASLCPSRRQSKSRPS